MTDITASTQVLEILEDQYLQLVPHEKMSFSKIPSPPTHIFQEALYNRLFVKDPNDRYHPPQSYTLRSLKYLIQHIQDNIKDDEDEIYEGFLNLYTTLLSTPKESAISTAQAPAFVTYKYPQSPTITTTTNTSTSASSTRSTITLLERRNVLTTNGHTGARTWEAAFALGEYLIHHEYKNTEDSFAAAVATTRRVCGKSVIELGAGTGFVSILAAHLGAERVLATDGDEEVCAAIQRNVEMNVNTNTNTTTSLAQQDQQQQKQLKNVQVEQLWWGTDNALLSGQSFDLVLGADVTYDTRVLSDLTSTISQLLSRKLGSIAVIAATLRNQDTLISWEGACESAGLKFNKERWIQPEFSSWIYPTDTPVYIYVIHKDK